MGEGGLERRILRVEETKTGEPLELPVTRQLAAILARRRDPVLVPRSAQCLHHGGRARTDVAALAHQATGQSRRDDDITEGYAADWTVEQLRDPAQRVADRIDELMNADADPQDSMAQAERVPA